MTAPTYLQPPWFYLYFVLLWFGVIGILAHWSGWVRLAERFRTREPVTGDRFRFASGQIGRRFLPVHYGNCLFVTVTPTGVHLSLFLPFRFLSPPLFIPWTAFETVTRKRRFWTNIVTGVLRDDWPRISLSGAAGDAFYAAFSAARLGRPTERRTDRTFG